MLKIDDLEVKYDDFIAVSSATLSIAEGEIAMIIGANGSGKSSLLSAVSGLIRPSAGSIHFAGEDITNLATSEIVNRGLCLVPQGGRCFTRMTVYDNLMMGSYPKLARGYADESLERVWSLFPVLKEKCKAPARSLSGGQRQMLAIGRALMARPRCVIFDEVSLGLAPVAIKDLYARIRQINREEGITVVLVEQDTNRALSMADSCFVMVKGTVAMSGRAKDLSVEAIKSAYFGI